MKNIIDCLEERGLIEQKTSENLNEILEKPTRFYIGFDPTADSLHIGNLVGIVVLRWLQKFGHIPYVIIGGATGRIGDPSGKSIERPFLSDEIIENNVQKLTEFFQNFFSKEYLNVLNNNAWFKNIGFIEFLRDVGKHFRMGPMLSKESVKLRINTEEGMSFTEFSYQALQGYDFYHLFKQNQVTLQVGGSDQWGNILAGIDLTKKLTGKSVNGLTFPLLVNSTGQKFGKSEKGAIWLSEDKLSPYDFYQYLYRVSDADVIRLMKMLTFMDMQEIYQYEKKLQSEEYEPNSCQKRLAHELTKMIHKEKGVELAQRVTKNMAFGKNIVLTKEGLDQIAKDVEHKIFSKEEILGKKYVEIAHKSGLTESRSEATRLIKNNGAYLNNNKIDDINYSLSEEDLIEKTFLLLGAGKKKKLLIEISSKKHLV